MELEKKIESYLKRQVIEYQKENDSEIGSANAVVESALNEVWYGRSYFVKENDE